MMPGLFAGRFQEEECAIDLAPLCEATGIELLIDTVLSLDTERRSVRLASTAPRTYTTLSINAGSKPPGPVDSDNSIPVIPAKPFQALASVWRNWQQGKSPKELALIGGGPAAVELALGLQASLPGSSLTLVTGTRLLEDHPPKLAARVRQLLSERNIRLIEGQMITRVEAGQIYAGEVPVMTTDALVLATGAAPLDWYAGSGLACDDRGFIRVRPTLQDQNRAEIFAAGDSINLPGALRSGVYSVRQGSILAHNIPAALENRPMKPYRPQSTSLALLSTADGGALMSYAGLTAQGRLFGFWKDHLDRSFMRAHRLP